MEELKLAKWAGFKNLRSGPVGLVGIPPDDSCIMPIKLDSLDFLFKWFVPKVRKLSSVVLATTFSSDTAYDAILSDIDSEPDATDDNPALALRKVIEKLIEENHDRKGN